MQQKRKLCRRETCGTLEMHFSAGSESSMTFSLSIPKFVRVTQGDGIPTNQKVKGGLVGDYHKAKTEALRGLLLRVAAISCWITQEPLDEGASTAHGVGKDKTCLRIPRHRESKETELSAEQHQKELGNSALPFEMFYHLFSHFPFMLFKKPHHPIHKLLVKAQAFCLSADQGDYLPLIPTLLNSSAEHPTL